VHRGRTGLRQGALNAGPREVAPPPLAERLGHVLLVEARAGARRQLHNACGQVGADHVDRAPTPAAMSERCYPALPVRCSQPPHVPGRDALQLGCLAVDECSSFEVVEYHQPPLLCLIQGDPVLHKRTN